MRAPYLCLAILLIVPHADAAPAPAPSHKAKEKLEALKKRLPALLDDWQKKREDTWPSSQCTCNPELRLCRMVGTDRAKAVIRFAVFDRTGAHVPSEDLLLTLFLSYYDGCWTIERSEVAGRIKNSVARPTFAFLMLAIDEAAEK